MTLHTQQKVASSDEAKFDSQMCPAEWAAPKGVKEAQDEFKVE